MKKVIATSQDYNSLQMLRSVTYYYDDGSSATHDIFTKRNPKTVKSTLEKIVEKCNQHQCSPKKH